MTTRRLNPYKGTEFTEPDPYMDALFMAETVADVERADAMYGPKTAAVELGDVEGHPFHGNQYTDGVGSADDAKIERATGTDNPTYNVTAGKLKFQVERTTRHWSRKVPGQRYSYASGDTPTWRKVGSSAGTFDTRKAAIEAVIREEQDRQKNGYTDAEGKHWSPISKYGVVYDPANSSKPEVAAANKFTGWDDLPTTPFKLSEHQINAQESHVKDSSIDKVVSGREALREGYDPQILIDSKGDAYVIDGHHRVAMYTGLGRDVMPSKVYDVRKLGPMTASVEMGEAAGHPFRGNQYKDGESGPSTDNVLRPDFGSVPLNDWPEERPELANATYDRNSPQAKALVEATFNGRFAGLNTEVTKITTPRNANVGARIQGRITDDEGNSKGIFYLTMDAERHSMYFDGLDLNHEVQGQGFSAQFMDHVERWSADHGIDEIRLQADLSIGGYAWAKDGYQWESTGQGTAESQMRDAVFGVTGNDDSYYGRYQQMDETGTYVEHRMWEAGTTGGSLLSPQVESEFRALAQRDDMTPLDVASVGRSESKEIDGREMWAGKWYMMHNSWDARKDITSRRSDRAIAASAATDIAAAHFASVMRLATHGFTMLRDPKPVDGSDYNRHHLTFDYEDPYYWSVVGAK